MLLPTAEKINLLVPLLSDNYKAIRIAAASTLVDSKVSAEDQTIYVKAFKELQQTNEIISLRGEGRLNTGINALQSGDLTRAEKEFKATIDIEPYFESGYINLADLYRSLQKLELVLSVLIEGMRILRKSGAIKYSYGLYLVRQKQLEEAITFFVKAMSLSPNNAQYAYTYVLAIDGIGERKQALKILKSLILNYSERKQLCELGLYLSQKK